MILLPVNHNHITAKAGAAGAGLGAAGAAAAAAYGSHSVIVVPIEDTKVESHHLILPETKKMTIDQDTAGLTGRGISESRSSGFWCNRPRIPQPVIGVDPTEVLSNQMDRDIVVTVQGTKDNAAKLPELQPRLLMLLRSNLPY